MKKYDNPVWEPCFKDISPTLAKIYFATNFGPLRYFVATLIFKKLSWMEQLVSKHDGGAL